MHEEYMRQALALAQEAAAHGEVRWAVSSSGRA